MAYRPYRNTNPRQVDPPKAFRPEVLDKFREILKRQIDEDRAAGSNLELDDYMYRWIMAASNGKKVKISVLKEQIPLFEEFAEAKFPYPMETKFNEWAYSIEQKHSLRSNLRGTDIECIGIYGDGGQTSPPTVDQLIEGMNLLYGKPIELHRAEKEWKDFLKKKAQEDAENPPAKYKLWDVQFLEECPELASIYLSGSREEFIGFLRKTTVAHHGSVTYRHLLGMTENYRTEWRIWYEKIDMKSPEFAAFHWELDPDAPKEVRDRFCGPNLTFRDVAGYYKLVLKQMTPEEIQHRADMKIVSDTLDMLIVYYTVKNILIEDCAKLCEELRIHPDSNFAAVIRLTLDDNDVPLFSYSDDKKSLHFNRVLYDKRQ